MPDHLVTQSPVLVVLLALLVRAGFAAYTVGLSRSKHATSEAIRSLLDACFGVLAFGLIGPLLLGPADVGWRMSFPDSPQTPEMYYLPVLLAGAILPGALAERSRFWAGLLGAAVLGGAVMPAALWLVRPGGWLTTWGPGASAGAFAMAGAGFAAAAAWGAGPRANKYHRDGSTSMIPGHSLPLAILGAMTIVTALVPLAAARAGRVDACLLAVAAGGAAACAASHLRFGKPDVGLILTGVIGAGVAVVVAPSPLSPWAAALCGAVAGVAVPYASVFIDTRLKVDDPVAGVAIYGVGGACGLVVGSLVANLAASERLKLLGASVAGGLVLLALGAAVGALLFGLLRRANRLRAKEADEYDGLDLAEHDVAAYPDFQQNTIRSFHMREA